MEINFEKFEVNEQERSIVFSCASSLPYERYDEDSKVYYKEVLVINEDSVDMSRLNTGNAVVLFNHDVDKLLGIVDKAWIVEDKIFVKVRFSQNDAFSTRIYRDIIDGVVKNISIGYEVIHYVDKKENNELYRYVDKFLIFEVSVVSIAADPTVGIRSKDMKKRNKKAIEEEAVIESNATEDEKPVEAEEVAAEEETVEDTETQEQAEVETPAEEETPAEDDDDEVKQLKAENEALKQRIEELEKPTAQVDENSKDKEEIEQIAKDFNVPDEVKSKAITNKMTSRDFKKLILTKNFNITKKDTTTMNSKKEFRDYLTGREFDKPFVLREYTGFGGRTGENGEALISTDTLPLVQVLAKNMGVKGFRTLTGLTSNISIPVQSTRNPVSVKGLRDAASNSNPVFSNKTLTPIKIAGATRIAKELLIQANDDVVAFIIDSLTREISYKMEDYMLGKVAAQAGNTVSYASLEAIDWADILAFESYVASYALNDTAFVMSPAARAALKGTEKAQNTAQFLCDGENRINGYACNVSGCVENNDIFFGDWSKLIVGLWGEGLEIIVNPYTFAKEGDVEVVANVCMDAVCEQADAFVLGVAEGSNSDSNA